MMNRTVSTLGCVSALMILGATAPTSAQASSSPYLGDIMITGSNFCPRGWAKTEGQLIAIAQNQSLFSLLGTTYGGDGRTTFGLPDIRGRAPTGQGAGPGMYPVTLGSKGGRESATITEANMAQHQHSTTQMTHGHDVADHTHDDKVHTHTGSGTTNSPDGASFATYPAGQNAFAAGPLTGAALGGAMASDVVRVTDSPAVQSGSASATATTYAGGSQPIDVREPRLVIQYCIATQGLYPPRN